MPASEYSIVDEWEERMEVNFLYHFWRSPFTYSCSKEKTLDGDSEGTFTVLVGEEN